jgi:hypothetical protein
VNKRNKRWFANRIRFTFHYYVLIHIIIQLIIVFILYEMTSAMDWIFLLFCSRMQEFSIWTKGSTVHWKSQKWNNLNCSCNIITFWILLNSNESHERVTLTLNSFICSFSKPNMAAVRTRLHQTSCKRAQNFNWKASTIQLYETWKAINKSYWNEGSYREPNFNRFSSYKLVHLFRFNWT